MEIMVKDYFNEKRRNWKGEQLYLFDVQASLFQDLGNSKKNVSKSLCSI